MEDLSLLHTPLLRVETSEGLTMMTLPEVLHALWEDRVVGFDALQPHQEQAFYSFAVQLGALAVTRANDGDVPSTPDEWADALLRLTGGNENAWRLVVADPLEPAFMQSPIPEGSLDEAGYKNDVPSPSTLDVLVTSKNHDVKQKRIMHPEPEHWVYALVTLQTMEGFLGRGNYGISRGMNGGFGNRPFLSLSPELSFGSRFKRDLGVLVDSHDSMRTLYDPDDGKTLLWTIPWDGKKKSALPLRKCDPHYIEICRRIRFEDGGGRIVCWRANTKGQRVDVPSSLNGRTEDPWVPVDKDEEKSLTLGGSGFTYEKLQDILLGGTYARPAALRMREGEDGAMYLTARAMVRGQGKTEGLHHRIVPVPEEVSVILAGETGALDQLARTAEARVKLVSEVESRVLRPAVASLLSAGRDGDVEWEQVQPWIDDFDQVVDDHFFKYLWTSVRADDAEAAELEWKQFLKDEAVREFEEAQNGVPMPDIRRWRAISAARSVFQSRIREVLKDVFAASESEPAFSDAG